MHNASCIQWKSIAPFLDAPRGIFLEFLKCHRISPLKHFMFQFSITPASESPQRPCMVKRTSRPSKAASENAFGSVASMWSFALSVIWQIGGKKLCLPNRG